MPRSPPPCRPASAPPPARAAARSHRPKLTPAPGRARRIAQAPLSPPPRRPVLRRRAPDARRRADRPLRAILRDRRFRDWSPRSADTAHRLPAPHGPRAPCPSRPCPPRSAAACRRDLACTRREYPPPPAPRASRLPGPPPARPPETGAWPRFARLLCLIARSFCASSCCLRAHCAAPRPAGPVHGIRVLPPPPPDASPANRGSRGPDPRCSRPRPRVFPASCALPVRRGLR